MSVNQPTRERMNKAKLLEALKNELEYLDTVEDTAMSLTDDAHLESVSLKKRDIQREIDSLKEEEHEII